jgi:hypothetical protein
LHDAQIVGAQLRAELGSVAATTTGRVGIDTVLTGAFCM